MMGRKRKYEYEALGFPATRTQLLEALEREAHLWFAFAHKHSDSKLLSWYRNLLSAEELKKYKSFYFNRDRDLYLLTHWLLRATLSRYLEMAPEKLVFTHNLYGRPEIAQSVEKCQLRFSVSRTRGLVACLVVLSTDAGVDVEKIRKLDDLEILLEHVCTHLEVSRFREMSESDRIDNFFTFWTLKEAFVKARGEGLSLALKHFSFDFNSKGRIGVSLDAEVEDMPSNWQFGSFRVKGSHAVGLALRRKDRLDCRIRLFEVTSRLRGPRLLSQREHVFQNRSNLKAKKTYDCGYKEIISTKTLSHVYM